MLENKLGRNPLAAFRGETIVFGLALLLSGCATKSALPPAQAADPIVGTTAIDIFDGKTLSYTYDNGKQFTNTFEGNIRTSVVKRGTLHEKVAAQHLGGDRYLMVWEDDNMGMVVQVIDLRARTVRAAVPIPGGPQIWTANITVFE